uniref:Secreted protein n=1 Tax=Romanomermis culicivorax TaxID=13658 RepID=A0A915LB57_ROMCU
MAPVLLLAILGAKANQKSTISLSKLHVFSIIVCIHGRAQVTNTGLTIARGDLQRISSKLIEVLLSCSNSSKTFTV